MGGTIGIIQARMGSERLPGKILAPLAGTPLLARLWSRIRGARLDEWWLATSSEPDDDVTEAWGFELGLRVFRGHPTDVLSRFVAVGRETGAEWIVRVTADNPFTDAAVVDALLDARDHADKDRLTPCELLRQRGGLAIEAPAAAGGEPSAVTSPHLPTGYGVELVRLSGLERAAASIPDAAPHHRVHVTSWLGLEGELLEVPTPAAWPDRGAWRWTVDTYEDLAMARSAFRLFGAEGATIDYPAMAARLDAHPEIAALNAHVRQKPLEQG